MELQNKLKQLGWFLTEAALEKLSDGGKVTDPKQIQSKALNVDLREISSGGGLPCDINKGGKIESLMDNVVVQVMKVRNVAAPRVNEDSKFAPRMLKIQLTDGVIQYSGLEFESIGSLSLNTPPGTKILLKNGPIENSQGLLLIKSNQIQMLGGNVETLVEKWEVSRSILKFAKGSRVGIGANSGPPPWIAFGKKIVPLKSETEGGKFKSLVSRKSAEKDENSEFDSQRQDAIAEANRLGMKKSFGGGNKTLIDANVQKIMDEGYSEADAVHFLRIAKNNVRNALNILKNRNLDPSERPQRTSKKERANKQRDDDYDTPSTAPKTNVSLFDFLHDKLPLKDVQDFGNSKKHYSGDGGFNGGYRNVDKRYENNYPKFSHSVQSKSSTLPTANTRYENNISASFNRKTNPSSDDATSDNYNKTMSSNNYGGKPSESRSYRGGANPRSNFKNENYNGNNKNDNGYGGKSYPRGNSSYVGAITQEGRNSSERTSYQKSKSGGSYRDNPNVTDSSSQSKFQPHNKHSDQRSTAFENKSYEYPNRGGKHSTGSARQLINNFSGPNKSRRGDYEPVPVNSKKPQGGVTSTPAPPNVTSKPQQGNKAIKNSSNSHPRLQQEIIGFQNSKTNEYAMNMLKTQQAMETMSVQQKPLPAAVLHALTPVQNYQVPLAQAPTVYQTKKPNEFNWSIGERCMAKYWEDGKFYMAEITAVSKQTNVVHFLEYGNYEEILKKDCKPIMPNNSFPPPPQPAPQMPPMPQMQQQQAVAFQYHQYQQHPHYVTMPNNYIQSAHSQQHPSSSYGEAKYQQVYIPRQ